MPARERSEATSQEDAEIPPVRTCFAALVAEPPVVMRPEEEFRAAIERAGLTAPSEVIADGKLHRFASSSERRGDDAGWYVLHANEGIPAGAFGCWRLGIEESWRMDVGRELTNDEEQAHRARVAAARKAREDEEKRQHAQAAKRAKQLWESALQASIIHPYLRTKGIKSHAARSFKGDLVVPVFVDGLVTSLQFISAAGEKRFLPGGRVAGGYCLLGMPVPNGELVVCEGWATGASIHEATGIAVAVAFNAGNLLAVVKSLQARFAAVRVTLAADDDAGTAGNPGLTKATEAALAVGGLLAVPDFGNNRPEGASDFNDLARHRGADAVRACIERAARVAPAGGVQPGRSSSTPSPQPSRAPGRFPEAVQIIRADTIQPEAVDWLWRDFLAAGKLHILAGAPGTGKTTLALALAATLSCAGR
ncbi:MAG: toprim domain-containing protein, partial [Gemmatimonadetes bacterium]|nr:toprim domain-containing protein [Gemmatimonadota bacterium]